MRFRPAATAALVISALLIGLGVVGPAAADDAQRRKHRIDRSIDRLEHELSETSAELRAAARALRRAESRLPAARARVARVRGQLAAAKARDRMLGEKLKVAQAEVARAKREIADTKREIEATQSLIGRIARSSYQQGGYQELAVVFQAESPDDFATRVVLVQNAMRSEGAALERLAEDRADLAALKATLDAKEAQLAAMKREQELLVIKIQGLERAAVAAQKRVESLIAERSRAVARIEREKANEQRRHAAMQAESARLSRIIAERARLARLAAARAARSRASVSSGGGGGALAYPVSASVTSPYGMRRHPVTGEYKLHDGTDFGVGCGTPVRAAAGGTVVWASLLTGYGNQVAIDHGVMRGRGVTTSYSHLMRFTVGPGERVSRGEVVGYSGGGSGMHGAGYSTGCHLHFMVYVDGATTNPMGWL